MTPIHELLNRILWDKRFGAHNFTIGYYDRIMDTIIRVPFENVQMDKHDAFSLQVIAPDGDIHSVPFHRIREVYKDGQLIWHREH